MGISHRKLFYNNQDAYKIIDKEGFVVGVVCDGCGSCMNSEIGSKLTAEFVANYCALNFIDKKFDGQALAKAVISFYEKCSTLVLTKDNNIFISDTFFTTIIGFIFSNKQNIVFSSGDGVIVHNNSIEIIDQKNAPNYLAHNLLSQKSYSFTETIIEDSDFSRLLISTDGIEDLWESEDPQIIVEKLFSDENFKNEVELSKFLASSKIYDDTTMILIKKQF